MLNLVTAIGKPIHGVMRHFLFSDASHTPRLWAGLNATEQGWREVAMQFDVRNLTLDELAAMAAELYARCLITLEDVASIVPFEESWDMSLVSEIKDDIKRDWLTEYRLRVDFGDSAYPELMRRLLGHLERLDTLRRRMHRQRHVPALHDGNWATA